MCGMMLGIEILGHIIIGLQDHVSFREGVDVIWGRKMGGLMHSERLFVQVIQV